MNAFRNFDRPMIDETPPPSLRGYFKKRFKLRGKNWIAKLPPDDREAFLQIVRQAGDHGRIGGRARAASAQRDEFGRFAPKEQ